jgi:SAM-dependent methyltransferase
MNGMGREPQRSHREQEIPMPVDAEPYRYASCVICASRIAAWRVKRASDASYCLDRCRSCGYTFVNPRPSPGFLASYYSQLGHSHNGADRCAPSLQSVLAREQTEPNSTIDAARLIATIRSLVKSGCGRRFLDVGCGYGFFSKQALDAGFEVIASEPAETERTIAEEMTGIRPAACSFEDLDCAPGSLSAILMSQTLEHALDVNSWVARSRDLLASDGIIAIALPNFGSILRMILQENDPYICPPAHLNFFNPRNLARLLARHGFKVEAIHWISRIPKSSLETRLPRFAAPLLPIIVAGASASLKIVDTLHLGIMINVYGRKVGA